MVASTRPPIRPFTTRAWPVVGPDGSSCGLDLKWLEPCRILAPLPQYLRSDYGSESVAQMVQGALAL